MSAASVKEMLNELEEVSKTFRESYKGGPVKVVTHNDADGLTAGAIIHSAFLREGHPVLTRSVKQMEDEIIAELAKDEPEVAIFTDLGSSHLDEINKHFKCFVLVLDHHQPKELKYRGNAIHINPHFYGIDGAREISGSGVAYLFSKVFNPQNIDLSALAIVGAIGDLQDSNGEFCGVNRDIISDGVSAGVLKAEKDLRIFGRQTRPLYKAIEYTTEPFIPGLSGSESASLQFLNDLGIPVKKGEEFVMLADLNEDERTRLVTALILKMIEHKVPPKVAENIVGDVCTLVKEEKKTPLRDVKEFATLLNGCGKHEKYSIGLAVCLGDRGKPYIEALNILKEHKNYLSSCYTWILENTDKIKKGDALYYFYAGKDISENVIGTVASMVLNSRLFDPIKPVVALTETEKGEIKASARGTRELIEKGLNLGKAISYAAEKVGGEGGGHDIAAGAQIQKGKEEEFLRYVEEKVKEQMKYESQG